jgi:tryptophanyl-tRNA synthetase
VAEVEAAHAGTGYGVFKRELAELVVTTFAPVRERTEKMLADEAELGRLLAEGARRAGRVAGETMALVRERTGLLPPGRSAPPGPGSDH